MENTEPQIQNDNGEEGEDLDEMTKKIIKSLSHTQLKKIIQPYKPTLTEKQKERNDRLVEFNKAKWEKIRKEKEEHQQKQLKLLSEKVAIKPKQKYNKKPVVYVSDGDDESEDVNEYYEYKKWKETKKKIPKQPKEKQPLSDDDDEYIQKTKPKIHKATEILNSVNKLDNALKNLTINNPYLDAMNRR